MKKITILAAIILAIFATVSAKSDAVPAIGTFTDYPYAFSFNNRGTDTLTVESIIVESATGQQTKVHVYEASSSVVGSHHLGTMGQKIFYQDTIAPKENLAVHMVFGNRVALTDLTVSLVVRDQHGKRFILTEDEQRRMASCLIP